MKAEVFLADDYRPADDEPFMNDRQTEYFRRKLQNWKSDLMEDSRDTVAGMKDQTRNIPDIADRASEETDRALELRTRDRQRKFLLGRSKSDNISRCDVVSAGYKCVHRNRWNRSWQSSHPQWYFVGTGCARLPVRTGSKRWDVY